MNPAYTALLVDGLERDRQKHKMFRLFIGRVRFTTKTGDKLLITQSKSNSVELGLFQVLKIPKIVCGTIYSTELIMLVVTESWVVCLENWINQRITLEELQRTIAWVGRCVDGTNN